MESKKLFSGKWKSQGKEVKVTLPLIIFQEDNQQIAFCPALDLNGYGDTERQAIDAFQTSLGEYLLYTTNKGTLKNDLQSRGWIIKKSPNKPMRPPDMSLLLSSNDEFRRVFNTHDYKKINQSVNLPIINC